MEKINSNIIKQYKSYLDWLLLVYLKNEQKAKNIIGLEVVNKQDLQESMESEEKKETIHFVKKSEEYKIDEEIKTQLEWEYPYKISCNIPTMTTVSKIKEQALENVWVHGKTEIQNEENQFKQEKRIPEFMKEQEIVTKARIGTLVHLVLQKLNEKEDYDMAKIENLIKSLVQKGLITEKESEAINKNGILLYTKSDLFKSLKQAKQIYKETPFYFDISAKEIIKEEVDEKVLVQGIIDLYYIDKDDNLVLVDYKTDFVKKEEELVTKYSKQLEIYKRALQEAIGKNVDKVCIYSVHLQKMIDI